MAEIKNLEGLTTADLSLEIENGGRFIMYQYAVSILIMTFRQNSAIYFVRAGESSLKYGWTSTLISLFFGWWGIPWGPIYTIGSFITNLGGGTDVTKEVVASIVANQQAAVAAAAEPPLPISEGAAS